MKTSAKCKIIYEFLLITLKHVNGPRAQKLWARGLENGHKIKNDEFLVIPLKHANHPEIPKLWPIAHENGHKMQKMSFSS